MRSHLHGLYNIACTLIIDVAYVEHPCDVQGSPLQRVMECGSTDQVELLLDQGANAHVLTEVFWHGSLLYQPIERGAFHIVRLLLNHSAEANAGCEEHCNSILNHEAVCGTAELTALLLSHGADPNIRQDRADLTEPRPNIRYRDTAFNIGCQVRRSSNHCSTGFEQSRCQHMRGG